MSQIALLTDTLPRFLALLQEENRILVAQNWAALPEITAQKMAIIETLPPPKETGISSNEKQLLMACQKLNEQNGQLLQHTQQSMKQLQAILFPHHTSLYDANGEKAKLSTSGRRITA